MTPRDALAKLKGSADDKALLFEQLIAKAQTQSLEEWEVVMLEALKNDFTPKSRVVEMSATLKGIGGAEV